MEEENLQQMIEPAIHISPIQQTEVVHSRMDTLSPSANKDPSKLDSSKPHLIIVPCQDGSGHEKGLIQEVYQYPPGSLETVVERKLSSGGEESKLDRTCRRGERKTKNQNNAPQSSLASSSSVVSAKSRSNSFTSTKSGSGLQLHSDGLILHGSNGTFTSIGSEILANPDHRYTMASSVAVEKCELEKLSDFSSNISTTSDLSGYEDEYLTVKNILTFGTNIAAIKPSTFSQSLNENLNLKARIEEQEVTIKFLQSSKDDLEIQVHRLAARLQNVVREKEICQEQLDIVLEKVTEKNHQEYFELQKRKANLEGQYEALKIEYQHCQLNNEQVEAKHCQQKMEMEKCEKEKEHLCQALKEFKETIHSLEEQNLKLEYDLKVVNEMLSSEQNGSLTLESQLVDKENCLRELEAKAEAYHLELKNCQAIINNLKKWNLEREENHRLEKVKIENLLSESTKKYNLLKENDEWYQLQLSKAQKLQSCLQSELIETKNSLTILSAERDRCKGEAERLNIAMEDSRANAVKEKSSLLIQLAELEADMREREATIRRLEKGNEGVFVKVSEERFKLLEEDHKKLQELKIEVRDGLTYSNSLKEELKHKMLILKKHEETIHNLRKDFVVTKEEIESKQLCIDSLTEKFSLTKSKLDQSFEKIRENEVQITQLVEQKLKLEASLTLSEEEKRHVDETVARLREDMNKLSCSFFRMKHDLLAKDKRIETLSAQNSQLAQLEKELRTKAQIQTEQIKKEEYKKLLNETENLKKACMKLENENSKVNEEICQLKKLLKSIEVERQSLTNSVNVRDEQISKLQERIDTYKEKIVAKEEEITTRKDHVLDLEKACDDLQKRFDLLSNECEVVRQERDEFRELEINKKNSITALKECIKLEKQSKENYVKKYEASLLELKDAQKLLNESTDLIEHANAAKEDFEREKDSLKLHGEEIRKLDTILEIQTKQIFELENKIKCLSLGLEESKMALTLSEKRYVDSINTKNNDIQSLHEALSDSQSEVERLRTILAEKEEHRICESKSNKKFVNSFRNPRKQQNSKQVPHNYSNNNRALRDDKREAEGLRQKLKEASGMIASKEKEISALKAVLSEQDVLKSRNNSLESEIEKMKENCMTLKEKNEAFNSRCMLLQEDLKRSYSDLNKKEKDCSDWKKKYENLMDAIPQRDTGSQQSIDVDHWQVLHRPKDPLTKLTQPYPRVDITKVEESLHQDFNLEERVQFTKTMAYLQNQISLTAESLQSKDQQIIELNKKLNALSTFTQSNSFQKSSYTSHLNSTLPEKPKNSADKILKNEQAETNRSCCEETEAQRQACEQDQVKSELLEASRDRKLSEREAEWKEKQRRYESNVRLLTRKLKGHMKGRRAAEKELGEVAQEHRKNLEAEGERYETLKYRFYKLEKESQQLQSEHSSCEKMKKESDIFFHNLKDELEKERKTVLQLQKENGHIEEVRHNLDILRTRNNSLMTELNSKNSELTEKEEELQNAHVEKCMMEDNCHLLTARIEELKQKVDDEFLKVGIRDEDIAKQQQEINEKNKEISHLRASHSSLQLKHTHLEEALKQQRAEHDETSRQHTEERGRLNELIDSKSAIINDISTKKDILERELKMKDESVESLRMDGEALKRQLAETEQKCVLSTALLSKKFVELKEMEVSLNERMNTIHKEKIVYQSQCTQLKIALKSALEKLQASSEMQSLPSPSPLNTETLSMLMEQCSKTPPSPGRLMASLTARLNGLREEVCTLQSEIKARDQSQLHPSK